MTLKEYNKMIGTIWITKLGSTYKLIDVKDSQLIFNCHYVNGKNRRVERDIIQHNKFIETNQLFLMENIYLI